MDLFDLAAKISADTKDVDRGLTATQKKVLALADEFKKTDVAASKSSRNIGLSMAQQQRAAESLQRQRSAALLSQWKKEEAAVRQRFLTEERAAKQAAQALQQDMQGALQAVSPKLAGIANLAGPLTIVAAGIAAVGAAAVAAGYGIFTLAQSAADYAGKIFDVSQKTNFAAETLSALQVAGRTSGATLESLTPSLIIFQKNMQKAAEGQAEMSKLFKANSIDMVDNEKALRQVFVLLSKMPDGAKQTAIAMQFFGRSGKDVLGVVKETNGDLDAAMKKYEQLGLIVSTKAAAAADQFTDSLDLLEMQLSGISRTIGSETLPAFTAFFQTSSADLAHNEGQWKTWGGILSEIVLDVESAWLGFVHFIGVGASQIENAGAQLLNGNFVQALKNMGGLMRTVAKGPEGFAGEAKDDLRLTMWAQSVAGGIGPIFKPRTAGAGGGGGGKRGTSEDTGKVMQRLADIELKIITDGFKEEENALERSLNKRLIDYTRYQAEAAVLENKRHLLIVNGLIGEAEGAEKIKKSGEQQIALANIKAKRLEEERRHTEAMAKLEDHILGQTRQRIALVDTLINQATRLRRAITGTRERRAGAPPTDDIIDLGGGSIFAPGGGTGPGSERPRRVFQQQFDDVRERMHRLADNITSILSDSIRTGFEQGAAAGFKTLLDGFVSMLAQMAEQMLASAVFNMLIKALSGGSGGFFSGGGILAMAGGGVVPGIDRGYDSVPAMLRPGERVIPRGQSGGGNVFNFHISTPNPQSFMSGPTQHQIMAKLNNATARAALVG